MQELLEKVFEQEQKDLQDAFEDLKSYCRANPEIIEFVEYALGRYNKCPDDDVNYHTGKVIQTTVENIFGVNNLSTIAMFVGEYFIDDSFLMLDQGDFRIYPVSEDKLYATQNPKKVVEFAKIIAQKKSGEK